MGDKILPVDKQECISKCESSKNSDAMQTSDREQEFDDAPDPSCRTLEALHYYQGETWHRSPCSSVGSAVPSPTASPFEARALIRSGPPSTVRLVLSSQEVEADDGLHDPAIIVVERNEQRHSKKRGAGNVLALLVIMSIIIILILSFPIL